jgi:hypothetical protein
LLFISISFDVFLSKRLLGAAEEGPNRGRIQFESIRKLRVPEPLTPQNQKFGVPRIDDPQHQPDAILFFASRSHFLGRRRLAKKWKQALVSAAPYLLTQFVERGPHCRSIQPSFDLIQGGSGRIPRPLQKNFHSEFLRAAWVTNDSGNDAGYALILRVEKRFQILTV